MKLFDQQFERNIFKLTQIVQFEYYLIDVFITDAGQVGYNVPETKRLQLKSALDFLPTALHENFSSSLTKSQ